jgi:hypothetical protein
VRCLPVALSELVSTLSDSSWLPACPCTLSEQLTSDTENKAAKNNFKRLQQSRQKIPTIDIWRLIEWLPSLHPRRIWLILFLIFLELRKF